jgi:hypothetical protein
MDGIEAIPHSPYLKKLRYVDLEGNPVNPGERVATESGVVIESQIDVVGPQQRQIEPVCTDEAPVGIDDHHPRLGEPPQCRQAPGVVTREPFAAGRRVRSGRQRDEHPALERSVHPQRALLNASSPVHPN